MKKIAVFASGSGTNFQAINDSIKKGDLKVELSCLICDKKCYCIERAKKDKIDFYYVDPHKYSSKAEYETYICSILDKYKVDLVCLAGYMRYIGDVLLSKYEGKIINIHPALLPSFKGAHGIKDAFEFGVKVMGVTIHYVDKGVDTGKIIAQKSFDVEENDTLETVEEKTHAIEHVLYPLTIKKLLEE